MNDKHPIDRYFAERLEDHETQPSEAVWQRIAAASPSQSGGGFRPIFLMRAAAVVLLLALGAGLYFYPREGGQNPPMAGTTTEGPQYGPYLPQGATQLAAETEVKNQPETATPAAEEARADAQKSAPASPGEKAPARKVKRQTHPLPAPADEEEALYAHEEELNLPELDPGRIASYESIPVKVSFSLRLPVESEKSNLTDGDSLKQRPGVAQYASAQWNNLRNGRPMELPALAKGNPQLEINLNRLFASE